MPTASTRSRRWRRCRHDRMTTGRMIELAAAVAALVAGIWFYRRRRADGDSYGSQGAVLLFVVAAIMAHPRARRPRLSPEPGRARHDEGARAMNAARPPRLPHATACAATQAADAVAPHAPGFLARPVARPHLPGRLGRVAVRAQRRDLRRAQQRRLVRFRLFPRHRRVRRRRPQDVDDRLPRPRHQRPRRRID